MDIITKVIYTVEYYLAIKKVKITFGTAWMDLENIMLNEISQTERQKCHMISLTCGQTEVTRKIETDS